MKKTKLFATVGAAVLSASILAACSNNTTTSSQGGGDLTTYKYVFSGDPKSLDYILANQAVTSDVTTQMVDGLLENDEYGNLVPSLATDWSVSEDGLTYTYTLRDGVFWYTSDGEEYAPVTAHDFVTGLKHAVDGKSDALYVVEDSVKNLKAYKEGKVNWEEVGVKALDDKTVQYTLNQPESYWNSKVTYSVLFPVNAKFLQSKGKDFGALDPSSILVNGAYFLSAYASKSLMEFTKNDNYWDADNVHVQSVKLTYTDGSDPGSYYRNFDKGEFSIARLYPNDPTYQAASEKYQDNIVYGLIDGTTYYFTFNLNRSAFANSTKTPEQQESAKKAMLNKDFRQAVMFALDRAAYQAQTVGEEAKTKALRNMLVPPTFVSADGEDFGQMVKKDLVGYGTEWQDVDLSDSQDGLYNPQKAKEEFAKARQTLEAQGVTFPIYLDFPIDQADSNRVQQAQSFKQSVESSLGQENIIINVIETETSTYESQGYYAESPEQQDYDIMMAGWSPDYQDPRTYLDIMSPIDGAMLQKTGIHRGGDKALVKQVGLDTYQTLLNQALVISNDNTARYNTYAKAQALLIDSALQIPMVAIGGVPRVSKGVPFSGSFSWAGNKGGSWYKRLKLQAQPVTTEQYEKAYQAWQSEKSASNAKYADSLVNRVKKSDTAASDAAATDVATTDTTTAN